MGFCINCGQQHQDGIRFCRFCGNQQPGEQLLLRLRQEAEQIETPIARLSGRAACWKKFYLNSYFDIHQF